MDLWRSLKLVREQFILFIASSLIAFVVILVMPTFTSKKLISYKSSAKILITPNSAEARVAGERPGTGANWFTDEATLKTLLSSQGLLESVIETCGLKLDWVELRTKIELDILSQSGQQVSLIEISGLGDKPEEARLLTQTVCEKFVAYVQQLSTAENDKTVVFLERERRNAEREVARAHKRLIKLGIIPTRGGSSNPLEDAWVQLQEVRAEQEKEVALAQVELEQLSMLTDPIASEGAEGASLLDTTLEKEQLKLDELREIYTEHSPQVIAQLAKVKKQQMKQQARFQQKTQSQNNLVRARLEKAQRMLAQTNARMKTLEAQRPTADKYLQYAVEERQLSMWQENLLDLTKQLYRARVMQQSSRREGAFTIVEKPQPGLPSAGMKVAKSPLVRILMAIPMALFCGLAVVLLVDYLTASMRMQPRIEEALGLPIIGSIPFLPSEMVNNWDAMKGTVRKSKSID